MPNKLRTLSGSDLVLFFEKHDFNIKSQSGSYIKMHNSSGKIILIPNHKEIRKGTLKAIFSQALSIIPEQKLREYFYTE